MKKSEIFETVKNVLIETLGVEEDEEITLKSKLIEDLGAESIDFLDIMSRLERRFDITLDMGEALEEAIREMVSEEELESGFLTPEVIEELPKLIPEVDPAGFTEELRFTDIPLLYTVDSMVIIVQNELEKQENIIIKDDMKV